MTYIMIKNKLLKITCILVLILYCFTFFTGSNNKNQIQQVKFGNISKNNITSFKIHNIDLYEKEIKNKSDRDKIIDLINSVKITKSGIEERDGVGFGVTITYSNGKKFSASFLSQTMVYSFGGKAIYCNIDKNIVDDLRNYYNETKVAGIDKNKLN